MVNSKRTRIAQLAGKIETTSGSAETITASEATILAYEPVLDIVPAVFQRNPVLKHMDKLKSETGARQANLNFKAELMGPPSGSKGTTLPISPFLKACGLSEALVASVSNTFTPISSSFQTMTCKKFEDGFTKTILGVGGNVKFMYKVGEPVMCDFTMQGKYASHLDESMLSPTYPNQVPLMFMGATVQIHGSILVIDTLELDMQNEIVLSPLPSDASGIDYAKIVNRRPVITFDPELVAKSDFDFYSKMLDGTVASISIRINDSNGNMMELSLPKTRFTGITEADRSGLRALNANMEILSNDISVGNDSMTLFFGTSSSSSSSSSSRSSSSSSSSSSST
jgi:hypothetical protein